MAELAVIDMNNQGSNNKTAAEKEHVKSLVWMDIMIPLVNGELVAFTAGVPLDTQQPLKVGNAASEFNTMQRKRNMVLASLQKMAADMDEGAQVTFPVELRIRKLNAHVEFEVPEIAIAF